MTLHTGLVLLVAIPILGLAPLIWLRQARQPIWGEIALGAAFALPSLGDVGRDLASGFIGERALTGAIFSFAIFAGLAGIVHAAYVLAVRRIRERPRPERSQVMASGSVPPIQARLIATSVARMSTRTALASVAVLAWFLSLLMPWSETDTGVLRGVGLPDNSWAWLQVLGIGLAVGSSFLAERRSRAYFGVAAGLAISGGLVGAALVWFAQERLLFGFYVAAVCAGMVLGVCAGPGLGTVRALTAGGGGSLVPPRLHQAARWTKSRWRQVGLALLVVYVAGPSVEVEWRGEVCPSGYTAIPGTSMCSIPRPTVRPASGTPEPGSLRDRYGSSLPTPPIPIAVPASSFQQRALPAAHRVSLYMNNLRVHLLTVGDELEGFRLDW